MVPINDAVTVRRGKRIYSAGQHKLSAYARTICASDNNRVTHKCKTPGCSEGYITVDGNEYLKRSKCALPMEKVKIRKDLPQIHKCCPNSPLPGGKSQRPSKFCRSHQSMTVETSAEEVTVPPEFITATAEAGLLTEEEFLAQQNAPCGDIPNETTGNLRLETAQEVLSSSCGIFVD